MIAGGGGCTGWIYMVVFGLRYWARVLANGKLRVALE